MAWAGGLEVGRCDVCNLVDTRDVDRDCFLDDPDAYDATEVLLDPGTGMAFKQITPLPTLFLGLRSVPPGSVAGVNRFLQTIQNA